MQIKKVGVIGCGLMGHGIAQVAAQGGCSVVVVEAAQGALDAGLARIEKSVAKLGQKAVEKGKATAEQAQADGSINPKLIGSGFRIQHRFWLQASSLIEEQTFTPR